MGPVKPQSDEIKEIVDDKKVESSLSPHKLLKMLSQEIDDFYENPDSEHRKKIEALASELKSQLKNLFQTHDPISQIKDRVTQGGLNLWNLVKRARRILSSDEVDDYGLDRSFELAIKPIFDFLYYKYFRVSVVGIENIPENSRGLLVANHSGVLPYDAAMIKIAIFNEHPARRELRFLVDDFVFHFPFLGVMMNRIGGVRACPENAERLLHSGELVSVFPEGMKGISKNFSERYRLQRFGRGGVIRLALKTKAPIIPVAVIGAEEIHPLVYKSHVLARPLGLPFIPVTPTFPILGPLGAVPLPTKWTIVFGKPIPFDHYTSEDLHDGILINRETERLRETIQDMIYQVLKDRRSIFFG